MIGSIFMKEIVKLWILFMIAAIIQASGLGIYYWCVLP